MKLKSFAFACIALIFSQTSFGQQNRMDEENRQWAVMISAAGIDPIYLPQVKTLTSYLKGDTAINGVTYKKVYSSYKRDLSESMISGCIRQNNEQVFYLPAGDTEEKLYFDFSLKTGNTFVLDDITRTVSSIGELSVNGTNHKMLTLLCGSKQEYWVEGIGSLSTGIFSDRIEVGGAEYQLLCCHQGETLLYMNEVYDDCYLEMHTDIKNTKSSVEEILSVLPNDRKVIFTLKNSFEHVKPLLAVYNNRGEQIVGKAMTQNEFILRNLSPGVYFYVLKNGEKVIERNKFIIID